MPAVSTSLAVLFALVTALANAIGLIAQHRASTTAPGRGWALVAHLARQPLWLLGWVAMVGSLVGQALALHFGSLSLVQPLLVAELVFALILRRLFFAQHLPARAWVLAATTTAALAAFLIDLAPHPGSVATSPVQWTRAVLLIAVGVGFGVAVSWRRSPRRRAGGLAIATALLWALEAAFIRQATGVLVASGVGGLLSSWSLYATIACGAAGLVSEQSALHVGPLTVSQPLIVIVDPLASMALGLGLEHDHLRGGPVTLVVAALAFVVVAAGVTGLTRAVPDHLGAVERLAPEPPV